MAEAVHYNLEDRVFRVCDVFQDAGNEEVLMPTFSFDPPKPTSENCEETDACPVHCLSSGSAPSQAAPAISRPSEDVVCPDLESITPCEVDYDFVVSGDDARSSIPIVQAPVSPRRPPVPCSRRNRKNRVLGKRRRTSKKLWPKCSRNRPLPPSRPHSSDPREGDSRPLKKGNPQPQPPKKKKMRRMRRKKRRRRKSSSSSLRKSVLKKSLFRGFGAGDAAGGPMRIEDDVEKALRDVVARADRVLDSNKVKVTVEIPEIPQSHHRCHPDANTACTHAPVLPDPSSCSFPSSNPSFGNHEEDGDAILRDGDVCRSSIKPEPESEPEQVSSSLNCLPLPSVDEEEDSDTDELELSKIGDCVNLISDHLFSKDVRRDPMEVSSSSSEERASGAEGASCFEEEMCFRRMKDLMLQNVSRVKPGRTLRESGVARASENAATAKNVATPPPSFSDYEAEVLRARLEKIESENREYKTRLSILAERFQALKSAYCACLLDKSQEVLEETRKDDPFRFLHGKRRITAGRTISLLRKEVSRQRARLSRRAIALKRLTWENARLVRERDRFRFERDEGVMKLIEKTCELADINK